MKFLAPLGFIFAVSIPLIVAFYLLKLRRVRRDVPSTMLWKRAAEDMHANAPFQKLRRNLLLLLQLIIAALLVLGLARPFMNLQSAKSRAAVLMIDNSAGMGTRDGEDGATRLETAKEQARKYVADLEPGSQAMLISFASKPQVISQFTPDRKRLETLIGSIEQTDLPTQADEAVVLAQSLAKPLNAELIIFSDGAFNSASIRTVEGAKTRYVAVGKEGRNAAITALDLRRPFENSKDYQVFATVRNFGDKPQAAELEVRLNGKILDVRPIQLGADAEGSQIFTSARLAEGTVELRLTPNDAFAADNSAFAVIKPMRKRRVLLVSSGNYFLERVLSHDRGHEFEIIKMSAAQYTAEAKADVTIFDGVTPAAQLPPGSYFFINARPPIEGFAETGVEEEPTIFDWDKQHPVMRFAEMSDVQIQRAKKFTLPAASQVLAESRDTPLVSVFSAGNRHVVLWSFNIFETNLPVRVAFPIITSNSMDWLLKNVASNESAIVKTGQVIQTELPKDATKAAIKDPSGKRWTVAPDTAGRVLFDRTTRAGFYELETNGKTAQKFGVSLVDAEESAITPRTILDTETGAVKSLGSALRANREVWPWFAAAALAFVMLEWLIYHRRIWV